MTLKTVICLVPGNDVTPTSKSKHRQDALDAAEAMARDRVASQGEYIARPPQLIADFGCVLDQWNTAALAIIGNAYSVFQAVVAPAVGLRQVIVWYKISSEAANVSFVIFQEGAQGRTTFAVLNMEELYAKQETEGFLSEPIVYPPGSIMRITAVCRIVTGAPERLTLGGFVVEPTGPQISG